MAAGQPMGAPVIGSKTGWASVAGNVISIVNRTPARSGKVKGWLVANVRPP